MQTHVVSGQEWNKYEHYVTHAEVIRVHVSVKNIRLHVIEYRELCRLKV